MGASLGLWSNNALSQLHGTGWPQATGDWVVEDGGIGIVNGTVSLGNGVSLGVDLGLGVGAATVLGVAVGKVS